jgi:hypothetical protein
VPVGINDAVRANATAKPRSNNPTTDQLRNRRSEFISVRRNELRAVIERRFTHPTGSEPAADTTSLIEDYDVCEISQIVCSRKSGHPRADHNNSGASL